MATYVMLIGVDTAVVQPGWSLAMTANGRNVLRFAVNSADGSYRPALDAAVYFHERVPLSTSSVANPSILTTSEPHGIVSGQQVAITGHVGSTPDLNGWQIATRISPTTFSIPVNVTVGGAGGVVGRVIFGGTITKPSEAGWGGLGVVPITTTSDANDFNAIAEHRFVNEVLLAGTLKSQLTTLVAHYLPGGTLHPSQDNGPAMPACPCDYAALNSVLDALALATGRAWELDEFMRLRMFAPSTEAAPINVIDGDGHAIGDITVEPTRTNYANRVILRYSGVATNAYAFLLATANFSNGEQVTVGSKTYTFQNTLTDVDGNVIIGGDINASLVYLAAAISLGGGAGSVYAASMTANTQVTAYRQSSTMMKARALTPGAAGNSIACTTTAAHASWVGEGNAPLSTLAMGADQALTNVTVAENVPAQDPPTGIWEFVAQSPETTTLAAAVTLAAAILAVKLIVPRTVKYDTYALGLRPGQTQTITIAARNVNNTFAITDVTARNTKGNLVLFSVSAVEGSSVQVADQWRDTYKQWSGGVTGSAQAVSGGGGGASVVGMVYDFGGSDTEWVQSPGPSWIVANSKEARIDTTVRGSTVARCYVRLRARSGGVTAMLHNTSDGVTVGMSTMVSSTSFQTVSFPVALTPGSKLYQIYLLPSLANVDCQCGSAYLE